MNIECLRQERDFYIVNKPANCSFQDEKVNDALEAGFFNQCCRYFNEELYPVHRLDKLTSGLVILARNKPAAQWFQIAFENKDIQKCYIALSDKKPKKKQGSVIGTLQKARNSQWKLTKSLDNPAVTRFFSWSISTDTNNPLRLFLLKPETGKTHQLRVTMKSLSSVILGDELYGGSLQQDETRGYLHAYALKFTYGDKDIEVSVFPDFGKYFLSNKAAILDYCHEPFALNWPGAKRQKL